MKLGWQRGWGGNRWSLPYLVFILSAVVTICAWVWAGQIVGSKDRERFTYATEEAELAIKDRIGDQVDLLRASAATFKLQGGWTRDQFHSYVQYLQLGTNFRGSQGVGFIQRIQPSEVPELEKRMRGEGVTDFAVHPVSTNREVYPMVYLEPPTESNAQSVGFDEYSESTRREAMQAACDTGQPTISGLVTVGNTRSSRSRTGFLLFCPIYQGGQTPSTTEHRRERLLGFVCSRFRGGEIFRDVLEGEARHALNIEIFDAEPGKTPVRFYRSSRSASDRQALRSFDGYIPVQGRQWLVRYHSSLEFEQTSASWLVRWIPVSGAIVTLLLAAVSFSQVRAYRQLNDQTEILGRSEAYQRMLATVSTQLVESGATQRNFYSIGLAVTTHLADWFVVCLTSGPEQTPVLEHVWDENVGDDPSGVLQNQELVDWFLEQKIPARFELSHGPDPHLAVLQEAGLVSLAVAPLYARVGHVGVLVAGRMDVAFDEDHLDLLVQIASRIAVAFDNDRLSAEKALELEERTKAEEKVRRVNENLEQIVAERTTELRATNKELEAFCYSVSHDLRAPLRSVDGFSKSLLEDYRDKLDDQAKDYIARVRNASQRMDELITALLNLSRITRLEIVRQPIDLTALASAGLDDALEGQDRSRYDLIVHPGMTTEADPKLIRVIFDNLLRNAIKFTAPCERARIEIGAVGAAFFVRDNGVGFNPAYSDKLFVAFERLHSQHEFPGSGIGLATVQRIVQRHGGTVWAESEEGKGATFFFTLR